MTQWDRVWSKIGVSNNFDLFLLALNTTVGCKCDMTSPTASLRIAATSDVHMHLTGWDPLRDVYARNNGMDRLASLIREARDSAGGAFVLVDNGDALQGTPLGDVCVDSAANHPWPAILNALDYDAIGLGNHDFDFGLPFLNDVMGQADCRVLCTNVTTGSVACSAPFTILERRTLCSDGQDRLLRIGLASVLPPQTAVWNSRCLKDMVHFKGGVDAAKKAVSSLRDAGADLVILLCHSGLNDGLDTTGENFGATIASEVKGIDAIVLGHTHLRFPGPDHAGFAGVNAFNGTVHGVPGGHARACRHGTGTDRPDAETRAAGMGGRDASSPAVKCPHRYSL